MRRFNVYTGIIEKKRISSHWLLSSGYFLFHATVGLVGVKIIAPKSYLLEHCSHNMIIICSIALSMALDTLAKWLNCLCCPYIPAAHCIKTKSDCES